MRLTPLPRRSFLDVRPLDLAQATPALDAVNIPLDELSVRQHELPPKSQTICLTDDPDWSPRAAEWLARGGRRCEFVPFQSAQDLTPGRLWEPHPLTLEAIAALPPGQCLDLGCGAGRDAIYLASAGWSVVAVDHLPDAIQRGRLSAERLLSERSGSIEWIAQDAGAYQSKDLLDLALMLFFLDRAAIEIAKAHLNAGGLFALECFTPTHRKQTGKPGDPTFAMSLEEAYERFPNFTPIVAEEAWRNDRHTLRWLARKNA